MIIRIDVNSDEAIYTQLSNQIKEGIAKGYLKPDEALPSVRKMAGDIGINMHTVSKAYNILKNEGIIVINRSRGVSVSSNALLKRKNDYASILNQTLKKTIYESMCNGIEKNEVINTINSIYEEIKEKK